MMESRRCWLMTLIGALGLVIVKPLSGEQSQSRPSPKFHPYPNGRDPGVPQGIDEPSHLDTKAIREANQQKLREEVSRLCEMAADLKSEVARTDATTTLSLTLIKKTQEIEKLARQIRNLAKGSS